MHGVSCWEQLDMAKGVDERRSKGLGSFIHSTSHIPHMPWEYYTDTSLLCWKPSHGYNTLGGKSEEKLHDIGFGNDFLNTTPKVQAATVKINKLDSRLKTSGQQRTPWTEWKGNLCKERKYLQVIYIWQEVSISEYIKNPWTQQQENKQPSSQKGKGLE